MRKFIGIFIAYCLMAGSSVQAQYFRNGIRVLPTVAKANELKQELPDRIQSNDSLQFEKIFSNDHPVNTIIPDTNGNIWLGTLKDFGSGTMPSSPLWISKDSGTSWIPIDSGNGFDDPEVWDVMFAGGGTMYAATYPNAGYYSNDSGKIWNTIYGKPGLPSRIHWGSSFLMTPNGVLLFGAFDGGVYRSTDDGQTWTTGNDGIPYPDTNTGGNFAPVKQLMMSPSEAVYALCGVDIQDSIGNHVMKSTDDGSYWVEADSGIPEGMPLTTMGKSPITGSLFVLAKPQVAGTQWEFVYRSTDNGDSWQEVDSAVSINPMMGIDSEGQIYVATTYPTWGFVCSTDDGLTWSYAGSLQGVGMGGGGLRKIYFDAAGQLYSACDTVAYRSVNSPLTSIQGGRLESPGGFALLSNYPNPFNPSTTIAYELPATSQVMLRVYDILGREVATLVDRRQNAGYHSVRFDAANLPTGVYFYKLEAGAYHDVRKLMLLK